MGYVVSIWLFMLLGAIVYAIWALGHKAGRKKYEQEIIEEAHLRERKREEREAKKYNPTRPKREVVFREVEEEEEEEDWEAPEPTGKHVYDPKAHRVVWVPNE